MNNKLITLIFFISSPLFAGDLVSQAAKKLIPGSEKKFFTTIVEGEQNKLADLKKMRAELQSNEKQFNTQTAAAIDQLKNAIMADEETVKNEPENEFIKRRLEFNLEHLSLLNDRKHAREELRAFIEEDIKVTQEYVTDPDLNQFIQELGQDKEQYSFDEDLLNTHEKILEQEKIVFCLAQQEANALMELENRKQAAAATIEAYRAKKEKGALDGASLSNKQKEELEALRETTFADRKGVDTLKIAEIEYKLSLIRIKLLVARLKLDMLNRFFLKLKPLTKVSKENIEADFQELDKKRQQAFVFKEEQREKLELLTAHIKIKERELDTLSKRFNIPLGLDLDAWTREARPTVTSYLALAQVGVLNDQVLLLKRKKDFLEAQTVLEDERLSSAVLRHAVKDSFYKMRERLFVDEEHLAQELKTYEVRRAENKANLALYKERLTALESLSSLQKKALENSTLKMNQALREKEGIFKESEAEYEQYLTLLKTAEAVATEQLSIITQTAQLYNDSIILINGARKRIDFIVSELSAITYWGHPEYAISWEGVSNAIPDIKQFAKDVYGYITSMTSQRLIAIGRALCSSGYTCLLLILKIAGLIGLLLVIKRFVPSIISRLISIEHAPMGIAWFSVLTAVFLGFWIAHVVSFTLWLLLLFFLIIHPPP